MIEEEREKSFCSRGKNIAGVRKETDRDRDIEKNSKRGKVKGRQTRRRKRVRAIKLCSEGEK